MGKSKRLEVIFYNGEPDGIRVYMRHLSPIKAYVVPRQYLSEAKSITGIGNPGVYFLINDETGTLTQVYIGQTQNGISRMDDHNIKKDFWNKAILFLADSECFTLNILSGLEKYAIEKAIAANRYNVDNKAVPKYKTTEYDLPIVEEIYDEIEFIMATLGYRMNESAKKTGEHVFSTFRRGIVAYGTYSGESFEVLPDSEVDFSKAVKLESYNTLRKAYLEEGTIEKVNDHYYLRKTISFKTPSGASDFILGGSTNGWMEWKDQDGKTLDELFRKQE